MHKAMRNHSGEGGRHLGPQGHAPAALVFEVEQLLRHLLAGLAHIQLLRDSSGSGNGGGGRVTDGGGRVGQQTSLSSSGASYSSKPKRCDTDLQTT